MPPDRAGRRAGRVDQHGVERAALPLGGIRLDDLGAELQPRQILPHALEARRRAVDGGDLRAGQRQLRGLAAGRGAEIGDGFAAHVAEQLRRQRRGGVLHPPRAVVVAGKLRDRARCDRRAPCRCRARGRRASAAQLAGSLFTVRSSAGSWVCADRDGARGRLRRSARSSAASAIPACRAARCRARRGGPCRRARACAARALTRPE